MRRLLFLILGSVIVVGIFGVRAVVCPPAFLEYYSSYVVYPMLQAQQKIVLPIKQMLAKRCTADELEQQLIALRAENENLKADNIELQALLSYAEDIKEIVEFKKLYDMPSARIAHVLARNISEQAHFMLLDVGADDGVRENMVAVHNNNLLGKVVEVYPWYCKVQLITDRACKVAASCAITNASGIHEGCNSNECMLLNRVSHLAQLQEGDLVLSSGEGLIFPKGFGIGRISSFKQDGLTYHVQVEPLIDIRSISYCCVIDKAALKANKVADA